MTDKVQKIREEVERLYNQSLADENRQSDRGLECAASVSYGKSKACKELLSFIDSLQEEPVSIWHDVSEEPKPNMELICVGQYGNPLVLSSNSDSFKSRDISKWAYFNDLLNLSNVQRTTKNGKEPASESLEKAATKYAQDKYMPVQTSQAFKAGANWQKEQLMKEPNLSGYVARDEDGNLHIFEVEPRRLEEKHRWWDRDYSCHIIDNDAFPDLRWKDEPICVKLIIIKEG